MTVQYSEAVERWALDRLVPHARNARTHSEDQVAQIAGSIAEFGELAVLWEQVRNSRFTDCLIRGADRPSESTIREIDGQGNVLE